MTTDAELNELCGLLPTLPDREPWLDLKFHAWEVLRDSREILESLPKLKRLLDAGTHTRALNEGLSRIDFLLMYPVGQGVRTVVWTTPWVNVESADGQRVASAPQGVIFKHALN